MLATTIDAVSAKSLYDQFILNKDIRCAKIVQFSGVGSCDVYNPTVPFLSNGVRVIAGRVEQRDSEDSMAIFFQNDGGVYYPIPDAPQFVLQDPFVTTINDKIIFGGVRVIWENGRIVNWVTDFYQGTTINDLKFFVTGPSNMKDIRLVELSDGRIGIFTRPQGQEMLDKYGCIARIGFAIVDRLEDITAEVIASAPLLEGNFLADEWGGVNQAHMLANGLVGVIGHISYNEELPNGEFRKHYYSSAFAFEPETRKMTKTKVICARDCFPPGDAKRPDLQDITFTSGIERIDAGMAVIYTGLNDCQIGRAIIPDPLLEYEQLKL